MTKLLFDKCPRCDGKWQELTFEGMKYSNTVCTNCYAMVDEHIFILKDFLSEVKNWEGHVNLAWERNGYGQSISCFYGSFTERVNGTGLKLPCLPYTISKEKFKLYLLFS